MIEYNISTISKVKTENLFDFYKKAFPNRYKILCKNWKWWYRNNYLSCEPIVLVSKNKIIGQAGLIPIKVKIKEKIIPAIWFIDYAILPEYQSKGLGKILTREWMKICPNQITFCNKKSLRIFKKFNWDTNHSTKKISYPINPLKYLPIINKFELNIITSKYKNILKKSYKNMNLIYPHLVTDNSKTILDSFNQKINKETNLFEILRDEDWFNWRLIENPFKKNIYFFEKNGSFAIVNIFKIKNIKRLNILYIFHLNKENEEEDLIKNIFYWSLNNSIDLVWANSNNQNLIEKYQKILTKRFSSNMNFASFSSDKNIKDKLKLGFSDTHAIDSDNDIISMNDNYS